MNIAKATSPGDDPDRTRPILTLSRDTDGNHRIAPHRHLRAQLLYAISGVMHVRTDEGTWVVPPQQAVWIPAGTNHEVRALAPLEMRMLYVHPDAHTRLPARCCVVGVRPLLRELVLALATPAAGDSHRRARLEAVALDELADLRPEPLHLPLPRDPRLVRIRDALVDDPADDRTLAAWAGQVGASPRTLARAFLRETGMSFGAWRQRLRLVSAIERLGRGEPVTRVAYDLGYQSPSAFVAMFRRELGTPPARYFRRARDGAAPAPDHLRAGAGDAPLPVV